MARKFSHQFNTPAYQGSVTIPTGLFIGGAFVHGSNRTVIPLTNGKVITKISEATARDVDTAVKAAQDAFDTTVWGLNASGAKRGELLYKLATLEALKINYRLLLYESTFIWTKTVDVEFSIETIKYYAGWADKITDQTLDELSFITQTDEKKFIYTRHEPIGVVVRTLRNFPLLMSAWKIGPALATNTIVLKPSEFTPLTALQMCALIQEAGFPPGVVNVVTGYGNTVGAAISSHMGIGKIAFTGSTLVGRKIMEAAPSSQLLPFRANASVPIATRCRLGGKSPNIIFDADLENANHGAACCAGSRIFVQSGIYDKFLEKFTEKTKSIRSGDPFSADVDQGPMSSEVQFNVRRARSMRQAISLTRRSASWDTLNLGRSKEPQCTFGTEGYYINPTIFTNTRPDMKIVQEEIFGPVSVIIKFKDEDDVIRQANDTVYGLASGVFSQNINRAIRTAHRLQAGTAWVNCFNHFKANIPFGGYKQSGIGREMGEYALHKYVSWFTVHGHLISRCDVPGKNPFAAQPLYS
ncbi:aldehyde dehydrogenase domain-containing protein [Mycena rosella]|uniref:Aldehyde dehydrogenase domain-containing protein n=1 Tax=Mycena rosella TaxID=1033263 RepID=A0AAD7CVY4_MYCRO|nr:aldehyde dehydrogenase domain-containing protein [Mycena rosella]